MVHYLKEISVFEAVIKDITSFQLFRHCKRDFLDPRIVFNYFSVSSVIM